MLLPFAFSLSSEGSSGLDELLLFCIWLLCDDEFEGGCEFNSVVVVLSKPE